MTRFKFVPLIVAGLSLAGCTANDGSIGPRQGIGIGAGAVVGAAAGSRIGSGEGRTAATIAGALLGGLVGNFVGRTLDDEARQLAAEAEYEAYASGQQRNWRSPTTNAYGQIAPGPIYTYEGAVCRNYTHTIFIDGTPQTARGRACQQPDGTWRPEALS